MRVVLVCPYSLSRPGGVQGQVLGIASTLVRLGHDVAVVAPVDQPVARAGFQLIPAGRSLRIPVNGSQAPIALGPLTTWRAWRAIARFEPDIVHVHEPFVPLLALILTGFGRWPVVATFHRAGAGTIYRRLGPLLGRVFARVTRAYAVSDAARATLLEVVGGSASRCELLANGVDVERFSGAKPWPSDRPALMFLGRLEPRKGLAVLLEAFSLLDVDAVLWVVGDGPQAAELRERYSFDARIEWCGALDDSDVARRLAGATICVAPALGGESFGVVLVEAMAAGTAVVASDIEGYRLAATSDRAAVDLVQSPRAGTAVLVPPGDPAALARALAQLLGDEPRRAELVKAGRCRSQELSMDRLTSSYVDGYRRLVGGGR